MIWDQAFCTLFRGCLRSDVVHFIMLLHPTTVHLFSPVQSMKLNYNNMVLTD